MDIYKTREARKSTNMDAPRRVVLGMLGPGDFVVYYTNEQTGGAYGHDHYTKEDCGTFSAAFYQAREDYLKRCAKEGLNPTPGMPWGPLIGPDVPTDNDSVCDGCRLIVGASALVWPDDLTDRLTPGGAVPSGECPECGMLCYLRDDEKGYFSGGCRQRGSIDEFLTEKPDS